MDEIKPDIARPVDVPDISHASVDSDPHTTRWPDADKRITTESVESNDKESVSVRDSVSATRDRTIGSTKRSGTKPTSERSTETVLLKQGPLERALFQIDRMNRAMWLMEWRIGVIYFAVFALVGIIIGRALRSTEE